MIINSSISIMVSFQLGFNLLGFSLDWNKKVGLFLILFSVGILCLFCAILLASYLLESDRFTKKPKQEPELLSYPSYNDLENESRLSRESSKVKSFLGRIKGRFRRSKDDSETLENKSTKDTIDISSENSEEKPNSGDNDPSP